MNRFYAACLAAYNNGHLHGAWIEASTDVEAMQAAVNDMLAKSPAFSGAEEWAIHDSEGLGRIAEYAGLVKVATVVEYLAEAEGRGLDEELALALLDNFSGSVEEATDALDEYQGGYDTLADWAEQFEEDTGGLEEVPERLRGYIDFVAMGRDAQLGGEVYAIRAGGQLHVFRNR